MRQPPVFPFPPPPTLLLLCAGRSAKRRGSTSAFRRNGIIDRRGDFAAAQRPPGRSRDRTRGPRRSFAGGARSRCCNPFARCRWTLGAPLRSRPSSSSYPSRPEFCRSFVPDPCYPACLPPHRPPASVRKKCRASSFSDHPLVFPTGRHRRLEPVSAPGLYVLHQVLVTTRSKVRYLK
ncbi:hypothetical protein HPB49_007122 [Dermacentor silvarum]|uniref:Uncharacterized protein n=1 Tax=Dermacentor silvarum TaxID=543639 RepID=A0ACB8CJW2_DERSI|nr:hypothetical protein HPB49_007122 [Dermacentor silvarum]